jgi:tRNA-dihydrouridine synthase A
MPSYPSIQDPAEIINRRFCVAPMMDCTDRYDRFLLRLITRHALLYTEMITSSALINGDRARLLRFDEAEHPLALQVGGSEPGQMAECARYAESYGYDEINVNVGCPSDRVQSGRFGACLMAEPNLVADCVDAMRAAVTIPVTVKTRIGIDRDESLDQLSTFVGTVAAAGCKTFIVHARRAWLNGVSPKQNRQIPPLNYERVYELKRSRPDLTIIINGGIKTLDAAGRHLDKVDGVMMGREAYATPYLLAQVDSRFYGSRSAPLSREAVLDLYLEYCEREVKNGCALNHLSRHLTGLFHGQAGARRWRRCVNEHARRTGAGVELIRRAAHQHVSAAKADHHH